MKVLPYILVVYLVTAAKAAYDQPLRNQLSFSAEFKKTGRVLAAFSSSNGTLNVCYELEGEKGWAMAESNDGYTWKQVSDAVLPTANEGDVVASKIVSQFSYLVVYDTGKAQVVIGGAKSSHLEGFVEILKNDGRSPTLFQIGNGIQYLALISTTKNEVNFFRVAATKTGGIQIEPATTSGFQLPEGDLRGLQVFCFDNDSTKCVLSYSANTDNAGFHPYYVVGKFEVVGNNLKFEPYIKNKISVYMMDGGQSASDFRLVNVLKPDASPPNSNVLAIGWNGNSDYEISPVTPGFGNGFTIARKMKFSDSLMTQTPVEFETKIQNNELFNAKDTVLSKTGITKKIDSKHGYLLDLFFYSSHDFEGSGYQIDLIGSKERQVTVVFNPTLKTHPQDMLMGVDISKTFVPAKFPPPKNFSLGLLTPPTGKVKIYIDMTTVTVSFENGLGLVTQSYNLGKDGPFTSYVIKSLGKEDLTLKTKSSITQFISIWSAKTSTDVPSGAVTAASLSFSFALIFIWAFFVQF